MNNLSIAIFKTLSLKLDGMYGLYHILYLIVTLGATIFFLIFTFKKKPQDKTLNNIYMISGIVLLLVDIVNRISITVYRAQHNEPMGDWYFLFPNTWCSLCSFTYAISLLFRKKDNIFYHYVAHVGFWGGLFGVLIPDFLNTQGFLDLRSITGLIHHSMMLFLSLSLFLQGFITPTVKKSIAVPIGFGITILIGLFQIHVIGYTEAMQIGKPFISSTPFLSVLTSWYILSLAIFVESFFVGMIYDRVVYKKRWKEIFLPNIRK